MDAAKGKWSTDLTPKLEGLEQQIVALEAFITAELSKSPSEVQKAFEAVLTDADIMEAKANAVNTQLSQRLRDCVFAALDDFMTLRRWITLRVPEQADGNNFGVDIQLAIAKKINDVSEAFAKHLDVGPDYHFKRATTLEKLQGTMTVQTVEVKSENKGEKEDKDGKQPNSSSSTSTTTTTTKKHPRITDDYRHHLLQVDVNQYLTIARVAKSARNDMCYIYDLVNKNKKKLKKPRGADNSRNMF